MSVLALPGSSARRGALAAVLLALALAACGPLYPVDPNLPALRPRAEWSRLLEDVRAYQERIGFERTPNFQRADEAVEGYVMCGHSSPLYLPYSYEDPAIRWLEVATEEQCRASAKGGDVSFAIAAAFAGRATPLTRKMLTAPFARFLYVVVHEDCHE